MAYFKTLFVLVHLYFALFAGLTGGGVILKYQENPSCFDRECFCEEMQNNTHITQPMSAWSNFSYLIVAEMLLVYQYLSKETNPNDRFSYQLGIPLLFLVLTVHLGFASFWHHAQHMFWSSYVDNLSIIWYIVMLVSFSFRDIFWRLFFIQNAIWTPVFYFIPNLGRLIIYSVYLVSLIVIKSAVLWYHPDRKSIQYFFLSTLSITIAFIFWIISYFNCNNSPVPLHAMWHTFIALSVFFIYLHFVYWEKRMIYRKTKEPNFGKFVRHKNECQANGNYYLRAGSTHLGSIWIRDLVYMYYLTQRNEIWDTYEPMNWVEDWMRKHPKAYDDIGMVNRVIRKLICGDLNIPFINKLLFPRVRKLVPVVYRNDENVDSDLLMLWLISNTINPDPNTKSETLLKYESIWKRVESKIDKRWGLMKQKPFSDFQDSQNREGYCFHTQWLLYLAVSGWSNKFGLSKGRLAPEILKSTIKKYFLDKNTGLFKSHIKDLDGIVDLESQRFIEQYRFVLYDQLFVLLDDSSTFVTENEQNNLYKSLIKHDLWTAGAAKIPGYCTTPDYSLKTLAWLSYFSGYWHYHDSLYWSWMIALSGMVALKFNNITMAAKIKDKLIELWKRDGTLYEVYWAHPSLERFSSWILPAEKDFSWGLVYADQFLKSYDKKIKKITEIHRYIEILENLAKRNNVTSREFDEMRNLKLDPSIKLELGVKKRIQELKEKIVSKFAPTSSEML